MTEQTTEKKRRRTNKPVQNPRPDLWVVGPDPVLREQRLSWNRAKAQAKFRGEEWLLSWEEWVEVWSGQWHRRGRGPKDLQLIRINHDLPWNRDNVKLADRWECNSRELMRRFQRGYISCVPSRNIWPGDHKWGDNHG